MHSILNHLVLLFGTSAVLVYFCARLKQPPIAGYLLSGVLLGSHGFALITSDSEIQSMAELGLIFLLFSIGVEFSIKQLFRIRGAFFIGGGAQFFGTAASVAVPLSFYWDDWKKALIVGVVVSLSSTAIVFKLLNERREMTTPYGELASGVLLFQDLMAVPLLALIPVLFGESGTSGSAADLSTGVVLFGVAKIMVMIGVILIMARWVMPRFLGKIAHTRSRELFLITIAMITFGCAVGAEHLGLSLPMGAFIAGLLISESQYGHQVLSDLVPLKEPFIAVFFVSVGLLLDVNYLFQNLGLVSGLVLFVFALKYGVAASIGRIYRLESRMATLFGILISQIGEFSFVVATVALQAQVLDRDTYQLILCVIVLTMLISPSLIRLSPRLAPFLMHFDLVGKLRKKIGSSAENLSSETDRPRKHVIIIGFGMNGQNLGRELIEADVPFTVIETNSKTVEQAKRAGVKAYFGDASRIEVLEAAGIVDAQVAVVAINDVRWISKVVHTIRRLRPDIWLVVRCMYLRDQEMIEEFRIDEIVTAELLTAKELRDRVFLGFDSPMGK